MLRDIRQNWSASEKPSPSRSISVAAKRSRLASGRSRTPNTSTTNIGTPHETDKFHKAGRSHLEIDTFRDAGRSLKKGKSQETVPLNDAVRSLEISKTKITGNPRTKKNLDKATDMRDLESNATVSISTVLGEVCLLRSAADEFQPKSRTSNCVELDLLCDVFLFLYMARVFE